MRKAQNGYDPLTTLKKNNAIMKIHNHIRTVLRNPLVVLALAALPPEGYAQFTDVSADLGITTSVPTNYNGSGISFYDFNGDGWDDLTIGRGGQDIIFLTNNEGTLDPADFTIPNGDGKLVNMVLWADYNNDGHPDLLVTKTNGPVELWMNDGEFNFTNVAEEAGLNTGNYQHTGAAFCDYDHDGHLDLYIAKFYHPSFFSGAQYAGSLYHNNGDGTFTDVTDEAGVYVNPRPTFQPVFLDYNNDGWEDLYLITDRIFVENALFQNNGDGTFTNVSAGSGADLMICSMTGTVGDYDNDGDLDIYITNSPAVGSKLLTNNGDETFTENAADMGVAVFEIGWGSLWLDYDNDSWQDLFVGLTTNVPSNFEGNRFFRNDGGEGFTDVSEDVGILEDISQTYTCAMGDLNQDGYYDFFINNRNGFVPRLYENNGGDNHYLSVSLRGVAANYDGTGSWIHCYAGGQHTVRFTLCGENLIGQNANRYIFGLGPHETIDSLVVEWNTGTIDRYYNLDADQHLWVTEGITAYLDLEITSTHGNLTLCPGDSAVLTIGDFEEYLWSDGSEDSLLVVYEPGTYTVSILTPAGVVVESLPLTVSFADESVIESSTVDENCYGSADGAVEITVVSGPGLDWVAWNTGDTATSLYDLAPDVYTYTAMNLEGCAFTGETTVEAASEIVPVLIESPISCYGDSTGGLHIFLFGGTPPHTIEWGDQNPDQLPAGLVEWLVTDAAGCEVEMSYTMAEPDALELAANSGPSDEDGASGWATLEVSGGTPPYAAEWSNGTQGFTAEGLAPGMYEVWVTDSQDCTESLQVEIGSTLHVPSIWETSCLLFPNPTSGTIWVTGCDLAPPSRYQILDIHGKVVKNDTQWYPSNPIELDGLSAGSYLLRVEDGRQSWSIRFAYMP